MFDLDVVRVVVDDGGLYGLEVGAVGHLHQPHHKSAAVRLG